MMPLQNTATLVVVAATSLTSAGTAAGWIDHVGLAELHGADADAVAVDFNVGVTTATGAKASVVKLSECDATSAVSNVVAITGLEGGATDGFTIPAVNTSNPTIIRMNVDTRARKRYLYAQFAAGTGTAGAIAITATLARNEDSTVARARMSGVVDKA